MRTTLSLVVISILAAAVPCAAGAAKTDTIKSRDFPGGGFNVGDTISATFTMTGNGSGTYTQNAVAVEGPNNGPIQVTFQKPPTAASIYYYNNRTGVMMNGVYSAAGGDPNIIDIIRIGDQYPIFADADGSLTTMTDVSLFTYDSSIAFNQSFTFVNGVCNLLPGTMVLDQGVAYSGSAVVGAFNEVGFVPTPGAAVLMGAGSLMSIRRRRN